MYRKLFAGAAVTTLALSTASVALAAGGAGPQAGGPTETGRKAALARSTDGVQVCNGGKQKAIQTKTNNQYSTFGEGADFLVPGATITFKGPKKGKDTINVTFSAEAQLRGSTPGDNYDWIELELLLDGTPIQPFGPADSPMAFAGAPTYGMQAAQFCTRVGKGWHTVEVRTRIKDNGNADTLTGWIDDTALVVERSE